MSASAENPALKRFNVPAVMDPDRGSFAVRVGVGLAGQEFLLSPEEVRRVSLSDEVWKRRQNDTGTITNAETKIEGGIGGGIGGVGSSSSSSSSSTDGGGNPNVGSNPNPQGDDQNNETGGNRNGYAETGGNRTGIPNTHARAKAIRLSRNPDDADSIIRIPVLPLVDTEKQLAGSLKFQCRMSEYEILIRKVSYCPS
jgi:hypothetical protein